jgi:hypothetical protein
MITLADGALLVGAFGLMCAVLAFIGNLALLLRDGRRLERRAPSPRRDPRLMRDTGAYRHER